MESGLASRCKVEPRTLPEHEGVWTVDSAHLPELRGCRSSEQRLPHCSGRPIPCCQPSHFYVRHFSISDNVQLEKLYRIIEASFCLDEETTEGCARLASGHFSLGTMSSSQSWASLKCGALCSSGDRSIDYGT